MIQSTRTAVPCVHGARRLALPSYVRSVLVEVASDTVVAMEAFMDSKSVFTISQASERVEVQSCSYRKIVRLPKLKHKT